MAAPKWPQPANAPAAAADSGGGWFAHSTKVPSRAAFDQSALRAPCVPQHEPQRWVASDPLEDM